jgi:O-antigen/teichoic acid export membrane protein
MDKELKHKTKKGVFWSATQRFSTQGLQFFTTIILANYLGPDEYGTIGMLSIFLAISTVFIDGGFINALTRKADRTHEDICTVFYFNIFISILAYTILFISAPYIASFYELPELCIVLRIIGTTLIIDSFSAVQATLLTIQLNFKVQTYIAFISQVTSSIIAIYMAYNDFSYWALVTQSIIGNIISTILYWVYSPWRPTLIFSRKSFNNMFQFGSKILVMRLMDSIYNNLYTLVIGKVFSASTLGNYSRADSYANFPSNNITGVLQRVTYPVLCKMQNNDTELSKAYRKFLKLSAFIIFPLMTGLSALSYPFILLLIGDDWIISAAMLQILCFALMWYPIHAININLLLVKGRSDLSLRLEILKKSLSIIILCVAIPLGIMALCYSRIITSLISLIINTYYTGKLINLGFVQQMKDLMPTIIISTGMWIVIMIITTLNYSMLAQMIIGLITGCTFYLIMSYAFNRSELLSLLSLICK